MKSLEELCGVRLTKDAGPVDLAALTVPDLGYISLVVPDSVNGCDELVDNSKVVVEYQADLTTLVAALKATGRPPAGFRLFVPDFWHVAHGRAKDLTEEDAALLWASTMYGHRLGRQFFAASTKPGFRHHMPGLYYEAAEKS